MKRVVILSIIILISCDNNSNKPSENKNIIKGKIISIDYFGNYNDTLHYGNINIDKSIDPSKAHYSKCFGIGLANNNIIDVFLQTTLGSFPITPFVNLNLGIEGNDIERYERAYKNGYIVKQIISTERFETNRKFINENDKLTKIISNNTNYYSFNYTNKGFIDTIWFTDSNTEIVNTLHHNEDGRILYLIDKYGDKHDFNYNSQGILNKITTTDTIFSSGEIDRIKTETLTFKYNKNKLTEAKKIIQSNNEISYGSKKTFKYYDNGLISNITFSDFEDNEFKLLEKRLYEYN